MAGKPNKLRNRLIMMRDFLILFFCSCQIIILPVYRQWYTEACWNSILPHWSSQYTKPQRKQKDAPRFSASLDPIFKILGLRAPLRTVGN